MSLQCSELLSNRLDWIELHCNGLSEWLLESLLEGLSGKVVEKCVEVASKHSAFCNVLEDLANPMITLCKSAPVIQSYLVVHGALSSEN